MPTIQEYKSAYDKAIAAGDTDSANELAGHINALAEQLPAPYEQGSQEAQTANLQRAATAAGGTAVISPPIGEIDEGALRQGAAGVVRYGAPIVAGIATSPLGPLASAAAQALTAGGSETLSQLIEGRPKLSGREIAASTIMGAATPIPLKPGGSALVNFVENAALPIGAGEVSRYVEKGQFEAPKTISEASLRLLLPVTVAAGGTITQRSLNKSEQALTGRAALEAERGANTPIAISEILPQYTEVEARQYQAGNKRIVNVIDNLDQNIGEAAAREYANSPRSDEIVKRLKPYTDNLEELRQKALAARQAADDAEYRATQARLSGAQNVAELEANAQKAGVNAVNERAMFDYAKNKVFGGGAGSVGYYSPGSRIERLIETSDAAKSSVSQGLTELYTGAGIKLDQPVATVDNIITSLENKISDPVLSGMAVDAAKEALKKKGMTTADGMVTLSGYRNIQDQIASGLVKEGQSVKAANRAAAEAYAAIKETSENFIKNAYPDRVAAFQRANSAAAQVAESKRGMFGAIELISKGDVDGLFLLIEKQGYGPVMKEIESYASALRSMGTESSNVAASKFKADISDALRDHLIETSLMYGHGLDDAAKMIDMPKLAERLDTLRSKGVVPEAIGLGSTQDIKALARMSKTQGGALSQDQLNSFLNDAALVGRDAAIARITYENAQKEYMMAQNETGRRIAASKVESALKDARMDADTAAAIYQRAANDPLVVALNNPQMAVNISSGDGQKYVPSLLGRNPDSIKQMMTALNTPIPGDAALSIQRARLAEDLKKSLVSEVLFSAMAPASRAGENRFKMKALTDFFYGAGNESKRNAFRAVVGDAVYNEVEGKYARPISNIVRTRENLNMPLNNFTQDATAASAGIGLASGRPTGGFVYGQGIGRIKNFIDKKELETAYLLFVDPQFSKAFRDAKYGVDAFVNASPRNMAAYRIAQKKDEDAKRSQPTP